MGCRTTASVNRPRQPLPGSLVVPVHAGCGRQSRRRNQRPIPRNTAPLATIESSLDRPRTCANGTRIRTSTGRHRPTNSNEQHPATPANNHEPPGRTSSADETGRSRVASKDAIDPQACWSNSASRPFICIWTTNEPAVQQTVNTRQRFEIALPTFVVADPSGSTERRQDVVESWALTACSVRPSHRMSRRRISGNVRAITSVGWSPSPPLRQWFRGGKVGRSEHRQRDMGVPGSVRSDLAVVEPASFLAC